MKEITWNELPKPIQDKFYSKDQFIDYVGVKEYENGMLEYTIKELSDIYSYLVNDEHDTNPFLTTKVCLSLLSKYFHIPKVKNIVETEIDIYEYDQKKKEDVHNG